MSVSSFKWMHFIILNYCPVLQDIFTMYLVFTHLYIHPISQILMNNYSQVGPHWFIRLYFQMLRQTTNNYDDDSYYYGSKGTAHWEPRERACDVNWGDQNALLEDVARSRWQPLSLATSFYWPCLYVLKVSLLLPNPTPVPNSEHFIITYSSGSQPS